MAKYSVWIDKDTGTWGDTSNLVFADLDEEEVDNLDQLSDSQIIAFASALATTAH